MSDQTPISNCCKAPIRIGHGCDADAGHNGEPCNCTDGTQWNECTQCGKPCDEYHEAQTVQDICPHCNNPRPVNGEPCKTCASLKDSSIDPEDKEILLVVEIKAKEIEVTEELEIGDVVKMSVSGTVKEIRRSRYWDRIDEEEKPKWKFMIEGHVADVLAKEHKITVLTDEDDDGGEI